MSLSHVPTIEVLIPGTYNTATIPRSSVVSPDKPASGSLMCQKFVPGVKGSCPNGDACKFIHSTALNDAKSIKSAIKASHGHGNFLWRSLAECRYPRLDAGKTLTVFAPNFRAPIDTIRSERILKTKGSVAITNALMNGEQPPSTCHCAHYFFNRACGRGADCKFIHCVHVDRHAIKFQRARTIQVAKEELPLPTFTSKRTEQFDSKHSDGQEDGTPVISAHESPSSSPKKMEPVLPIFEEDILVCQSKQLESSVEGPEDSWSDSSASIAHLNGSSDCSASTTAERSLMFVNNPYNSTGFELIHSM